MGGLAGGHGRRLCGLAGAAVSFEPLPNRREVVRQAVRIGGQRVYLDVGFYEGGTRVGELFLAVERTGGMTRWLYDEAARSSSKLLQWGAPLEEVIEGWVGSKGSPSGPVTGDARIKYASSILDYCGRYLGVYYGNREDLSHIKQEGV